MDVWLQPIYFGSMSICLNSPNVSSVCVDFMIFRNTNLFPVFVLLFVALWFILRDDLLYVFPCVILFLCFSVLLVFRLPRLGKRELISVLFVRLFGLCLFRFVGFLFLLGSWKGCGLWLWRSLGFSPTFFCYVDLRLIKRKKKHLQEKHYRTFNKKIPQWKYRLGTVISKLRRGLIEF